MHKSKILSNKILKAAAVLLMSGFILSSTSSCMVLAHTIKPKVPLKERMLTYMSEKYNTEFTFVIGDTQLWSADYSEMIVSSPEYPDASIYVWQYETDEFYDNCMAYVFKEDFEQRFEEIAENVYGDCVACSLPTSERLQSDLTLDSDLNDYLASRSSFLSITLFVSADAVSRISDSRLMIEAIKENECHTNFTIYYVTQDVLDTITTKNYHDILELKPAEYSVIGDFVISEDYSIAYEGWRT